MDTPLEQLIGPEVIAERWNIPIRTIYSWRTTKRGPRGIKIGKHLRYRISDVEAWLESQTQEGPAA